MSDPVHPSGSTPVPVPPELATASPTIRRRKRLGTQTRSYYAVMASDGEVWLPQFRALGYLEQSRLIQAAQAGDQAAKRRVWLHNARLAYSVANRVRVRAELVADAVQSGQIGLARAIERFEVERLHEFSTYAFHWVRQAITRHRKKTSFAIPIPDHLYQDLIAFRAHVATAPSRHEWFDARDAFLDRDPVLYRRMLRLHAAACPGPLSLAESLPNAGGHPLDRMLRAEQSGIVRRLLNGLRNRERIVLGLRHGLDAPELTLEEVGQRLGLTRERVRQIQVRAEAKLRRALTAEERATERSVPSTPPIGAAV